eukprot:GEMP01033420.1.p1 GENE.GEMP01033420.1~~GEMP01033420.1.p1  ORF type:complete len:658 (+),score=201.20 GEMP01033420.1:122-2095(+)
MDSTDGAQCQTVDPNRTASIHVSASFKTAHRPPQSAVVPDTAAPMGDSTVGDVPKCTSPSPSPSPSLHDSGAGVYFSPTYYAGRTRTVARTHSTINNNIASPPRLQGTTQTTGGLSSSQTCAALTGAVAGAGGSSAIVNPFFHDAVGTPFTTPFTPPRISFSPPIEGPDAHDFDDMEVDIPRCAHKMLRDWVRRARNSKAPMLKHRFVVQKPALPHNILLHLDNWSEIDHLCLMEPEAIIQAQLAHISSALSTTRASILEGIEYPKVHSDARIPVSFVPALHPSTAKVPPRPPPLPARLPAIQNPDRSRPTPPQVENGALSAQKWPPPLPALPAALPDPDSSRPPPAQVENGALSSQKRPPPLPALPAALPDPNHSRPTPPHGTNGALNARNTTRLREEEDPGENWESRFDAALESHLSKKRRRQEMARGQVFVPSEKKESPPHIAKAREDEARRAQELLAEKGRLTDLMAKFGELDIASWHKATKEAAAHKLMQEQLEQLQALAEAKWRAQQEELARVRLLEHQAQKEQERKLAEQKFADDQAQLAEERRVAVGQQQAVDGRSQKESKRKQRTAPVDELFRCLEVDEADQQWEEELQVMKAEEDTRKREEEARKVAREKAKAVRKEASQKNSRIDDMFATLDNKRMDDMFDALEGK